MNCVCVYVYVRERDSTRERERVRERERERRRRRASVSVLYALVLKIFDKNRSLFVCVEFYGPVNPIRSCRARSVYLTTRLLGRLSPLSG